MGNQRLALGGYFGDEWDSLYFADFDRIWTLWTFCNFKFNGVSVGDRSCDFRLVNEEV